MGLPIPQEVQESTNWLAKKGPSGILSFWAGEIDRLSMLVRQCSSTQEQRWALCPPEIRGGQKDFCSVEFHQLMKQYSLGVDKWITQFIFGFPDTGNFSRKDPSSDKAKPPSQRRGYGALVLSGFGKVREPLDARTHSRCGRRRWGRFRMGGYPSPSHFPSTAISSVLLRGHQRGLQVWGFSGVET